jgi:uncharacterized delta-60 repeat protein
MNVTAFAKWTGTLLLLLTLGACGGSDDGDGGGVSGGGGAPPVSAVIGPAGGTVTGPSGASVVIPPGALATSTTITITQTSAGAPPLPGGFAASGQMFAFTPHGTTFSAPVTITLPFDRALLPAGSRPTLYKTNTRNLWEQVAGVTVDGDTVSAQVTSFSFGTSGVERLPPQRQWEFIVAGAVVGDPLRFNDFDRPPWEKVELPRVEFGTEVFDLDIEDDDQKITLEVFSSANGVTFWASAEDQGDSFLSQTQGFIKRAENATLQFVITGATLQAVDFNLPPSADECPRGLEVETCHPLSARISFFAQAFGADDTLLRGANGEPLLDHVGEATLQGRRGLWAFDARPNPDFTAAWSPVNFLFTTDALGNPKAKLVGDIFIDVDLSSITVGTKFYVNSRVFASAVNRRGRESAIAAYVRDPARTGGSTVNTTGLELTNDTAFPPPPPGLTPPVACPTGPNPAAGVLQFSAATYRMLEDRFAGKRGIEVTRTQGSSGPVSATFTTTAGGTALPGVHYTPKSITVHFADGDTASRTVALDLLENADVEDDRTVNLVLSEPGGCATLGAQASAVLTILDDERPAEPPPPSGLDTSFDGDGKAALERFGGDRSGMALQADGKIVMVGGTFVDFILARFNTDGSIDRSFGVDGKVTTDMGSGLRQEEALAVAIQGDGKIVVVGQAAIDATPPAPDLPSTFAIARYNSDGSLDTGFGTGGKVSGSVNGIARAVAIQPDGKIVLVGDFELELSNGVFVSDVVVARFNANGSLDLPFGTSGTGQVATDIGGVANSGRNLVLQPNGAIVVSGTPQCSQPGCEHTDVVRYNANGTLDASFGSGGKVTLSGLDVGQGLVRQADGKLVLVGTLVQPVAPATSRFVLMRLDAVGNPDASFGTAGTASTALSENAAAGGIALQADGKLVVVGTRALSPNPNFIVARYNGDGSLDTGFANAGTLSIDFFGFEDVGENVLVQPDGRIVVGGLARNFVDGYGLARIVP